MVRDDHARGPRVHASLSVVSAHDALDQDRQAADVAQPTDVVERDRRVLLGRRARGRWQQLRQVPLEVDEIGIVRDGYPGTAHPALQADDRGVTRDDQRPCPGVRRPPDQSRRESTVPHDVDLEPPRSADGGCDVLQRTGGTGGDDVERPGAPGRVGDCDLPIRMSEPLERGRCYGNRGAERLTEQRGGELDGGHVAQDVRSEPEQGPCLFGFVERLLGARP